MYQSFVVLVTIITIICTAGYNLIQHRNSAVNTEAVMLSKKALKFSNCRTDRKVVLLLFDDFLGLGPITAV